VIAESERLLAVIEDADLNLFAGQISDVEAYNEALKRDFISLYQEGISGWLGLSKMEVTQAGRDYRDAHG
jgi:hypothetical protein